MKKLMKSSLSLIDFSQIPSPCYVLDESRLNENLDTLSSFKEEAGIKVLHALKGFALPYGLELISRKLDGASVSSLNEARLATECFDNHFHAYCPVFIEKEFEEIVALSNSISFNSLGQLGRFVDLVPSSTSIGLRINPEYSDVSTELYNPCAKGTRLGVSVLDLPENLPDRVQGFHSHNLCESGAEALCKTLENIERLFGHYLPKLSWLNLGGGHLITRKGYDRSLAISSLKKFKTKFPNLEIIIEPSAASVWQAGFLVSEIQDIVSYKGVSTAVLDVSVTAHMPDCLEMPYAPEVIGAVQQDCEGAVRLGGTTCLAGDVLPSYKFHTEPKVGDRVVFKDMMHYTMVKTTMFNGVAHPSYGVFDTSGEFKLLKTFDFSTYRALQ